MMEQLNPRLEIVLKRTPNEVDKWDMPTFIELTSLITQNILAQHKVLLQQMREDIEVTKQHSATMIKQSNAMTKHSWAMIFLTVVILIATISQVCVAIWK